MRGARRARLAAGWRALIAAALAAAPALALGQRAGSGGDNGAGSAFAWFVLLAVALVVLAMFVTWAVGHRRGRRVQPR